MVKPFSLWALVALLSICNVVDAQNYRDDPTRARITSGAISGLTSLGMAGRIDLKYGNAANSPPSYYDGLRWVAPNGHVFSMGAGDATFNGRTDNIFNYGYNIGTSSPVDFTEPYLYFSMEADYDTGTDRLMEWHLNYRGASASRADMRPIGMTINRSTHAPRWGFIADDFYVRNSDETKMPFYIDTSGSASGGQSGYSTGSTVRVTAPVATVTGLTVYGALNHTANVLETRNTINAAGNVPTFYVKHDASGNGKLAVSDRLGNEKVIIPGDGVSDFNFNGSTFFFTRPSSGGQVRLSGNNTYGSVSLEDVSGNSVLTIRNTGHNVFTGDNRDIVFLPNGIEVIRFGAAGGTGAAKASVTGTLSATVAVSSPQVTLQSGTEPTCNSTNRGALVQVYGGAGVKDTVRVCAKDASDVYAYRAIY
jgi:hypothetical protein